MDILSIAKENRLLMPFLDRLDLNDLMIGDEDQSGGARQSGLPVALPQTTVRPPSDAAAPAFLKGEPLMLVKAPDAPADFADGLSLPAAVAQGPVGSGAATGSAAGHAFRAVPVRAAPSDGDTDDDAVSLGHGHHVNLRSASGHGHAARAASGHDSKVVADPAGKAVDDPHVRATIDQDVDVDQDIDIDVAVSGATGLDVDADLTADVTIDQIALIDIDVETALPGNGPPVPIASRGVIARDLDIDDVDISNTQDVDIDTQVRVFVNGFAGGVFIRTSIDEDVDVTQSARPVIVLDGDDNGFDIDISQFLDIDLLSDIDIDISEDHGRLYITVSVKDSVASQDDALIALEESADDILDVDLRQSIDVDQKLVVHVDIEQELASLFDIAVDVDADLDVGIRQDADAQIDINALGEVDVDVDGDSQVNISNQLQIRIDFTHA